MTIVSKYVDNTFLCVLFGFSTGRNFRTRLTIRYTKRVKAWHANMV